MAAKAALLSQQDGAYRLPPLWRDALFWLSIALSIFAMAPFFLPGYFWGANDARHHVYFLFEFDRVVQDGVWWPRWSPDFAFGYGYPFFNIYGPFSHFLAEILLHFFGFTYTGAVKAVFVFSIAGSAGAMYAYVRSWLGRHAALIAALTYVYIPYHLLNLYVRANLAESMAFLWMPLCLWAARQAMVKPAYRWVVGLAVSYAGLMLTSNLVIVLFTPLLGLYMLVVLLVYGGSMSADGLNSPIGSRLRLRLRSALPAALGILAGLGLSAVFWMPMVLERQYVRVDQWFDGRYDYRGNFVYFFQLFSPRWGFGISRPGPDDPIGYQLGLAALFFAVLGVTLAWRASGRRRWEIAVFCTGTVVATLVGTVWGNVLWELPVVGAILGYAQFPWRWFSISALCLSVLSGLILLPEVAYQDARRALPLPVLAIAVVVIVASYPLLRIEIVEPAEGPVNLAGLMRFQRSSDEMTGSTAWVTEIPTWSPMADYYLTQDEEGGPVLPVETKLDYGVFDYERFAADSIAHDTLSEEVYFYNQTGGEKALIFNQFYYPGWRAFLLDGEGGEPVRELRIVPEKEGVLGRMTVPVPTGDGYIRLSYGDTLPRTVGRWMSWCTIMALAIAGILLQIRQRRSAG